VNVRALAHLLLGTCFGAAVCLSGAADFDAMTRMFLFKEGNLLGVAIVTSAVSAVGLWLLRRTGRRSVVGGRCRWTPRRVQRGTVLGSMLFGVGWGLSGTCPGTALVQVGQGHVVALFTLGGIVVGNALYDPLVRALRWPRSTCE
jgi:hypothetical protein